MLNLASGVWNTALGPLALNHDTNGGANTATGFQAFFYNTAGNQNTAYGAQALYSSRDGNLNTVIGYRALCNGGGNINTANGAYALYNNDDGVGNTRSVIARSLPVVTAAVTRPLVIKHLYKNTGIHSSGFSNAATGCRTLFSKAIGSSNTANGRVGAS